MIFFCSVKKDSWAFFCCINLLVLAWGGVGVCWSDLIAFRCICQCVFLWINRAQHSLQLSNLHQLFSCFSVYLLTCWSWVWNLSTKCTWEHYLLQTFCWQTALGAVRKPALDPLTMHSADVSLLNLMTWGFLEKCVGYSYRSFLCCKFSSSSAWIRGISLAELLCSVYVMFVCSPRAVALLGKYWRRISCAGGVRQPHPRSAGGGAGGYWVSFLASPPFLCVIVYRSNCRNC